MSRGSELGWPTRLASLLAGVALVELALLRTLTRTLIHIPGLADLESPIQALAEVGRFAYYLAVVVLTATMAVWAFLNLRHPGLRHAVRGSAIIVFLVAAAAGRLDLLTGPVVGATLLALVVVVAATTRPGLPAVPVALFVVASTTASLSVLGQGAIGFIRGRQIDGLMLVAEIALILAAVTAPLLLRSRPGRTALLAGAVALTVTAAAFGAGSSTVSILVLWNLGVSGWMPGVLYAVAAASVTTTLWSALASGARLTSSGLALLIAGGTGTISTYQTGLVLAGLVLIAQGTGATETRPDGPPVGLDGQLDRFDVLPALAHSSQPGIAEPRATATAPTGRNLDR